MPKKKQKLQADIRINQPSDVLDFTTLTAIPILFILNQYLLLSIPDVWIL